MVEVAYRAFIIDGAGTFSCYQCYHAGNRDKIQHEPLEVIKDISGKLK